MFIKWSNVKLKKYRMYEFHGLLLWEKSNKKQNIIFSYTTNTNSKHMHKKYF